VRTVRNLSNASALRTARAYIGREADGAPTARSRLHKRQRPLRLRRPLRRCQHIGCPLTSSRPPVLRQSGGAEMRASGTAMLWLVLCALAPDQGGTAGAGRAQRLEEMAWDLRFGAAGADSPLVGALKRMQARLMPGGAAAGLPGALCQDECGPIERLRLWGARNAGLRPGAPARVPVRACQACASASHPPPRMRCNIAATRTGSALVRGRVAARPPPSTLAVLPSRLCGLAEPDPWLWPHNESAGGTFCRVRRALAPLLAAGLVTDEEGNAVYLAPRGRYWKGCRLTGGVPREGCTQDSRHFSEHDRAWLDELRPLIASELADDEGCARVRPTCRMRRMRCMRLCDVEMTRDACLYVCAHVFSVVLAALAAQARTGAASSLDRILLTCARLACLARSAHQSPDLKVLIVGGGPVGLMSAIQARLVGVASVTIWDKRSLDTGMRANVVDVSESDRSSPAHPAALSLLENLGILHWGLSGAWSRSLFRRYLHPVDNEADETGAHAEMLENEWALKIEIRQLQHALRKLAMLLGVEVHAATEFVDVLSADNAATAGTPDAQELQRTAPQGWRAVGTRVQGTEGVAENITAEMHVLVGADGEWSSVRERVGFELITPEVRLKMSAHCAARARDHLQRAEAIDQARCRRDGFDVGRGADVGAGESRCTQERGAGEVDENTDADAGVFGYAVSPDCQHVVPAGASGDGGGMAGGSDVDMGIYLWRPLIVSAQATVAAECGVRQRPVSHADIELVLATVYENPTPAGHCQVSIMVYRLEGI